MNFIISAATDIGTTKATNQDSFNARVVTTPLGRMAFAVVCDGMGGLDKGEVASASVVNAFCKWAEQRLPDLCESGLTDSAVRADWVGIATEYNESLDAWTAMTGIRALPFGTYEIVETKAPEGYTGEGVVSHVVEIREDGQFDQLVEADGMLNEVKRGGVQVQKDDLELGKSEAVGGADHSAIGDAGYLGSSLSGIEFTVVNASEHGVMVEGTYRPKGAVVAVIETAWNPEKEAYTAQTASDTLPYGTYTLSLIHI